MDNKKKAKPQPAKQARIAPSGPFHFTGTAFHIAFVTIVILFSFIIYGNSIKNGYSMDDEFVTHNDSLVQKGVKAIPALFKTRYAWDQKGSYGYRPISKISFAIEDQFKFARNNPHFSHVINILLYDALCIFLFYFFRKILYEEVSDYFLIVFFAIFLVHPIHSEVVDSLKNRDALLSFLFGIICTFTFIKAIETDNILKRVLWILGGCISYNLGYLAKPDAIVFMAVTPLVIYFFSKYKFTKPGIIAAVASVGIIVISNRLRALLINHVLPHSDYNRTFQYFENPLVGTHVYQRIPLGFSSLWFYVEKLIFPVNLSVYYGLDEFHPFPAWTDATVMGGILVAAILGWAIYKKRNDRGVWLFSLLLFAGSIFAFVNVLRVGPGLVAERFMFIPSMGFALLVTLLFFLALKINVKTALPKKARTPLYLVSGFIVVLCSARVVNRNPDWRSHFSIYRHDIAVSPHSAKLYSLLADAYLDRIKKEKLSRDQVNTFYDSAYYAFQKSLEIYPKYSTSLNNLGMIEYLHNHDLKKATEYFERAIATDSNYTEALFNEGSALQQLGNNVAAEKYFLLTIKSNPKYDMAYIFLSRLYSNEGSLDKILELNEGAIKKGHATDAIYVNIGKVYLINGDTTKAIDYFNKALGYFNKNLPLCEFLEHYYDGRHDTVKARYYHTLADSAKAFNYRAANAQ